MFGAPELWWWGPYQIYGFWFDFDFDWLIDWLTDWLLMRTACGDTVYSRLCDEEDALSEVTDSDVVPEEVKDWLTSTFTRSLTNVRRRGDERLKFRSVANAIRAGIVVDRWVLQVFSGENHLIQVGLILIHDLLSLLTGGSRGRLPVTRLYYTDTVRYTNIWQKKTQKLTRNQLSQETKP